MSLLSKGRMYVPVLSKRLYLPAEESSSF